MIERVRTMIPIRKRKIPVTVKSNEIPMLSASALGSETPELPSVANDRVIPKTVPRTPKKGPSVSNAPRTIPAIESVCFVFTLWGEF
jgi:hypothetical protein